jgi:spermidine/putrescine transport system substrate-binding protein
VDARFRKLPFDPQEKYSLPYQWGTMGLLYDKDKLGQIDPSWSLVLDPARQPGAVVLIDSMRDMLAVALLEQGRPVNSRDTEHLKQAAERIRAAKSSPRSLGFEGSVGAKDKVLAGDAVMAIVWNGEAAAAIAENDKLAFALPKEGTIIWADVMTVSAQSPNPAGAHQFINFILDAKVGAQLSEYVKYATPNSASLPLTSEEHRQNPVIYPPDEEVRKMQWIEDLGDATSLYDEAWTTAKS